MYVPPPYTSSSIHLTYWSSAQRPSAKDLLKHKFVRMAKKTSYLTELIERHERWKGERGTRPEDDDDRAGDMYVYHPVVLTEPLTRIIGPLGMQERAMLMTCGTSVRGPSAALGKRRLGAPRRPLNRLEKSYICHPPLPPQSTPHHRVGHRMVTVMVTDHQVLYPPLQPSRLSYRQFRGASHYLPRRASLLTHQGKTRAP
jgi:hypothetical protein